MTTPYTNSMFQSIKNALAKNETSGASRYKELLKLEIGNTYTVRLLPNVKSPKDTFLHYFSFGWQSYATGQNILVTSPTSWSERDPIAEERYRVYKHGTPEEKKRMEAVRRNENWLVNALIVNDPVNPENNGKVKVIRYGRQIDKIIDSAINGEDKDEFGSRIFDLSKEGCNFKIKVEKQGDYPSYVTSKFQSPREIEGVTEADYEKIYNGIHDLKSFITVKSYDELKETFDQHFFCRDKVLAVAPVASVTAVVAETPAVSVAATPASTDGSAEEIENLLKGLDEKQ